VNLEGWVDTPYTEFVHGLESRGFRVTHREITLVGDLRAWRGPVPPDPPGYVVRSYRPGDESGWASVRATAFGRSAPPTAEFWEQDFRGVQFRTDFDPGGFFFAQTLDDTEQVVGICAGIAAPRRPAPHGAGVGIIGWTGVNPEHRGRGLGRVLFARSLDYLARRGVTYCEVGTQYYRTAAVRMYESFGFEIRSGTLTVALHDE
jgi:GNAT superfamily N-acetyltransferase